MGLSTEDITILSYVRSGNGMRGRLYYYQGNFHYPLTLQGSFKGKVAGAIRKFLRTHADLIKADRAEPDYLTPIQLMEAQHVN